MPEERRYSMVDFRTAAGLPQRGRKPNPINMQKFDELPLHHPCSPWKYEEREDDLNEFIAEPAPVEDWLDFG